MQNKKCIEEVETLKCDQDERDLIKLRLMDMKSLKELNSIDLKLERRRIPLESISLQQAENQSKIYENVSKLGINILWDYDFFSKLIVPCFSDSPLYETAMHNIGYERQGNLWYLKVKPKQELIIDLIFNFSFYSYVVQAKKSNQALETPHPRPEMNKLLSPENMSHNDPSLKLKIIKGSVSEKISKSILKPTKKDEKEKTVLVEETTPEMTSMQLKPLTFKPPPQIYPFVIDSSSFSSWECKFCSYRNNVTAEVCDVCFNPRNAPHKNFDHVHKENTGNVIVGIKMEIPFSQDQTEKQTLERINNSSKDTWTCQLCTYINVLATDHCEACFSFRGKDVLTMENEFVDVDDVLNDQPDERWLCKKCKTYNNVDVSKCSQCSSVADFVDKWICDQCTFYNYKLASICSACFTRNRHLVKCPQCRLFDINRQYGDRLCRMCKAGKEKEERERKRLQEELLKKRQEELIRKRQEELIRKRQEVVDGFVVINMGHVTNPASSARFKTPSTITFDNNNRNYRSYSGNIEHSSQPISEERRIIESVVQRKCKSCQKNVEENRFLLCKFCQTYKWICLAQECYWVNFKSDNFCSKCHIKKDADLSNGKCFSKWIDNREVLLYQCEFCQRLNGNKRDKCIDCDRSRRRLSCHQKVSECDEII